MKQRQSQRILLTTATGPEEDFLPAPGYEEPKPTPRTPRATMQRQNSAHGTTTSPFTTGTSMKASNLFKKDW